MKQSFRKIFGAVSAVFLIGLFGAVAPVGAASTDQRIKALEAELNQLKVEQQRVKQEQSQINADALAARSKLPSFRYRPGSGLRIRGADRSWEFLIRGEMSVWMSFFPNGGRSEENSTIKGPSQGSMYLRHQQWGNYAKLYNGLYDFGFNFKFDRSGGDQARASSQRMQILFSKWSPYYPVVQILHTSNRKYSRNTRSSSTTGHTLEREPSYDNFLATGSSKGLGLDWSGVPVGPGQVGFVVNYLSGNDQFNARVREDPIPQKGLVLGMSYDPLKKSKNKWLKGLNFRMNYVNVQADDNRGGFNTAMRIRARVRTNRVTIFSVSARGKHTYIEPSLDYTVGPFNLIYSWSRQNAEQRRTGGCGTPPCNNFSDAITTNNNISAGLYLWSAKKGFLSGSRNGGVRFSYTHNRIYTDAGSGGANAVNAAQIGTRFPAMRRNHYIENIMLLRWYQYRNLTWAVEYQINKIGKMKGGDRATETRRRANVLSDGGYYQVITLHTKWIF